MSEPKLDWENAVGLDENGEASNDVSSWGGLDGPKTAKKGWKRPVECPEFAPEAAVEVHRQHQAELRLGE